MTTHIWIRYRCNSSASYGSWEWKEFAIPDEWTNLPKKEFLKNVEDECIYILNEMHNTHSEHWRGIEWDVMTPPHHIVQQHYNTAVAQLKRAKDNRERLYNLLKTAPFVDTETPSNNPCREWPGCGCSVQSRRADCRPPFKR